MNELPLINIGTPHFGLIQHRYVIALSNTLNTLHDKFRLRLSLVESALIHANRNALMLGAYQDKADYLLFIDSDMVWNPEDIEKLVLMDRDVVTALCFSRKPVGGMEHAPCVFEFVDGKLKVIQDIPETPFKVDAAGTGFMLVKKCVIQKMVESIPQLGYPFDFLVLKNPEPGNLTGFIGEDTSFCQRLHRAGFDIWCEPRVMVGHITSRILVGKKNGKT